MWALQRCSPIDQNTVRFGYTLGRWPQRDEGVQRAPPARSSEQRAITGWTFAWRYSPDFFGAGASGSNYNLDQWGRYYKIVRKCNTILQNLDMPADMTNLDRSHIEGYTRFIRAYAYYNIVMDYGPAILLGDEVVHTNEPLEYYDRPRATYDETMDYTVSELEKAAQLLPEEVGILNFGRPTQGAAYALIARLRLIHASPLFNGGAAAQSYFGNWVRRTDNVHYVSQVYHEGAEQSRPQPQARDGDGPLQTVCGGSR